MYLLRTVDDQRVELYVQRSATEIGYSGPIGPLPQHMADVVRAWRDDRNADLAGDEWTERVRPAFVRAEPVLAMQAIPLDPDGNPLASRSVDLVFGDLATYREGVDKQTLESHTDQVEWSRRVIGVENLETGWLGAWATVDAGEHRDFVDELVQRADEGAQAAAEALDAAGVEPATIEPDHEPLPDLPSRRVSSDEVIGMRAALTERRTVPGSAHRQWVDAQSALLALQLALAEAELRDAQLEHAR